MSRRMNTSEKTGVSGFPFWNSHRRYLPILADTVSRPMSDTIQRRERVFLTAEWFDLVVLNYQVDPELLWEYVPEGTELDTFDGKTFVSLVGFRFCRTKVFGKVAVPFHGDFAEVNLRFYVRREVDGELRRGVVFVAEIVPRRLIAATARLAYGENYVRLPMRYIVEQGGRRMAVDYAFRLKGNWCHLWAESETRAVVPSEGSFERFITEHYWGYSRRGKETLEYQVEHPPWGVWPKSEGGFEGVAGALYGPEFGRAIHRKPDSAFIADGSQVTVYQGKRLSR